MSDTHTDPRLAGILTGMQWRVWTEQFVLVGVDPREQLLAQRLLAGMIMPFMQYIVEPDMVTLVLPEEHWNRLRPAFPHAKIALQYRLISFELDLPPDLVGFMATLSGVLAGAGIPLLAICGFTKDHLLVREHDLEQALAALATLKGE